LQNGHGETLKASTVEGEENIVAAAAVASTTLAAALVINMKLGLNRPASTGEGEREGL
jgi:hypothetical protein